VIFTNATSCYKLLMETTKYRYKKVIHIKSNFIWV